MSTKTLPHQLLSTAIWRIQYKTLEAPMAFKPSLSYIFHVDFDSVCLLRRWRGERTVGCGRSKRLNRLTLAPLRLGWPQWVMHSTPTTWVAGCWPPWGATTATTTTATGQLSRNQTTSVSFHFPSSCPWWRCRDCLLLMGLHVATCILMCLIVSTFIGFLASSLNQEVAYTMSSGGFKFALFVC